MMALMNGGRLRGDGNVASDIDDDNVADTLWRC